LKPTVSKDKIMLKLLLYIPLVIIGHLTDYTAVSNYLAVHHQAKNVFYHCLIEVHH